MRAAILATGRARHSHGQNFAVTGCPSFSTCQSIETDRTLSNRNTASFKNACNLLKIHAERISNRNTKAISAASRLFHPEGLSPVPITVHKSRFTAFRFIRLNPRRAVC